MRVVLLTNKDIEDAYKLIDFIKSAGDEVIVLTKRVSMEFLEQEKIDIVLSYSHRFLVKEPVLKEYDGRMINLHPSYLPYGRGYFPNFWSFIEDTPKGVTIHYIDATIDTGDIIYKEELHFTDEDTLRTSYYALKNCMHQLFMDNWDNIKNQNCPRIPQNLNEGTLHYKKDFDDVAHLLPNGWDTKVRLLKKGSFREQIRNLSNPS